MTDKIIGQGHVGTRIAWVRLSGPVYNIFYVVAYIPHKGRTVAPVAKDTIRLLKELLKTVKKSDYIILAGDDFNCQIQKNVQGCTGQWCMTKIPNINGHGEEILNLIREYDLFAVDTSFKPGRKLWKHRYRYCNATYLPKDEDKRPTKLDYLCVSNRYKSMVTSSEVRWGPSIHRCGQHYDHGLLSATWRWKTKKKKKEKRTNFAAMTTNDQSWPDFDEDLRIRLQKREEPQVTHANTELEEECGESKVTAKDNLATIYDNLATCVFESIKAIVPEQQWIKKNGRVVSEETKTLFEERVKEFQKQKSAQGRRKE